MASTKQAYGASAALTITLASLGADGTLLSGRQSTAVANGSNLYLDYLVGGKITTGTTPSAGTIEVWVYGSVNDTPLYPDVMTGTDGTVTATSRAILASGCRLGAFISTSTTSNQTNWIAPFSIASLFGGMVPNAWGLFVTQGTGVALNATGSNHAFYQTGVYSTVA